MAMAHLEELLSGNDLRSLGASKHLVSGVRGQREFDRLFEFLLDTNRAVVMRAADVVEKITSSNPQYLAKHKLEIFALSKSAKNKELLWHLAQLIPRCEISGEEPGTAWHILSKWAKDKSNSRIVRVNSLQGLAELAMKHHRLMPEFQSIVHEIERENIPSLRARLKILNRNFYP